MVELPVSQIDTLVAANIHGKQLKDILSGDLQEDIASAYMDVLTYWNDWRTYAQQKTERDIGALESTRPDIAQSTKDHIAALDELKKDNHTPIQNLKPINPNVTDLLQPAKKRTGNKDKLAGLRVCWLHYEQANPDATPSDVRDALLAELAIGDIQHGYEEKPGLSDDQKAWFKSLTGNTAQKKASGYRFDLLSRS